MATSAPASLARSFPATDIVRLTVPILAGASYIIEESDTYGFGTIIRTFGPQAAATFDIDLGAVPSGGTSRFYRARYKEGTAAPGPPSSPVEVTVRAHAATGSATVLQMAEFLLTLNGLVALYEPDSSLGAGRVRDLSSFANHGTMLGGAASLTNALGSRRGLRFDGVSGYMEAPIADHLNYGITHTVGFLLVRRRATPKNNTGAEGIVRQQTSTTGNDIHGLLFRDDAFFHARTVPNIGHTRSDVAIAVRAASDNTATLIAFDSAGSVWIDGQAASVVITPKSGSFTTGANNKLIIGGYRNHQDGSLDADSFFQGDVILPFFFNRVLTPTEHSQIQDSRDGITVVSGDAPFQPGTVALFSGPPDITADATPDIVGRIEGDLAAGSSWSVQIAVDQNPPVDVSLAAGARQFTWESPTLADVQHSLTVNVIEHTTPPPLTAPALDPPTTSDARIQLTATAVQEAVAYEWFRGTGATQPATLALYKRTTSPVLDDTGLTNGTKYWYQLRAIDATGTRNSVRSNVVSGTPAAVVVIPPPSGAETIWYVDGSSRAGTASDTSYTFAERTNNQLKPYTTLARALTDVSANLSAAVANPVIEVRALLNNAEYAKPVVTNLNPSVRATFRGAAGEKPLVRGPWQWTNCSNWIIQNWRSVVPGNAYYVGCRSMWHKDVQLVGCNYLIDDNATDFRWDYDCKISDLGSLAAPVVGINMRGNGPFDSFLFQGWIDNVYGDLINFPAYNGTAATNVRIEGESLDRPVRLSRCIQTSDHSDSFQIAGWTKGTIVRNAIIYGGSGKGGIMMPEQNTTGQSTGRGRHEDMLIERVILVDMATGFTMYNAPRLKLRYNTIWSLSKVASAGTGMDLRSTQPGAAGALVSTKATDGTSIAEMIGNIFHRLDVGGDVAGTGPMTGVVFLATPVNNVIATGGIGGTDGYVPSATDRVIAAATINAWFTDPTYDAAASRHPNMRILAASQATAGSVGAYAGTAPVVTGTPTAGDASAVIAFTDPNTDTIDYQVEAVAQ